MGYINDNLLPKEKINYFTKLHWIIFIWPTLFAFFGIMALAGGKDSVQAAPGLFMIAAIWGGLRCISYLTSEFAVTDKRVMIKVGFIRRRTLEMQLPKLETVGVNQSVLGRILNYGTIVVVGAGGTREPFAKIQLPLRFRQEVFNAAGK
jgi:uncharacterized membrane protein YdbT with pleckstrin-like domain